MAKKTIKIDKDIYYCDYCGKEIGDISNSGDFSVVIQCNYYDQEDDFKHTFEYGSSFARFGTPCKECAEKFADAAYYALREVGFRERCELENDSIEEQKKIIFGGR